MPNVPHGNGDVVTRENVALMTYEAGRSAGQVASDVHEKWAAVVDGGDISDGKFLGRRVLWVRVPVRDAHDFHFQLAFWHFVVEPLEQFFIGFCCEQVVFPKT